MKNSEKIKSKVELHDELEVLLYKHPDTFFNNSINIIVKKFVQDEKSKLCKHLEEKQIWMTLKNL